VEVLYLSAGVPWTEKGHATLSLPGLDLPVSRTGFLLYHPPLTRVTVEAGAFRMQPYAEPGTTSSPGDDGTGASLPSQANSATTQALVDRYRARRDARRPVDTAPLRVEFPAVGPSLYLASELTAENHLATIELNYQKERKGGRQ
jgi:hypothetical protein